MADTLLSESTADKLYRYSGEFTSTVKTSFVTTSIDGSIQGLSCDENDTYWTGNTVNKFFRASGFFTSTIKSSLTHPSAGDTAAPDQNHDVLASDDGTDKLYHYSSNFTSTIKTSLSTAGTDASMRGNTFDGTDTPWCGSANDKLYQQSGYITSTIKTSLIVVGVDSSPTDAGWTGTDTLFCGNSANKMFRISGLFTTTVKSSLAVGNSPRGIETLDFSARTGFIPSIDRAVGSSLLLDQALDSSIRVASGTSSLLFGQSVAANFHFLAGNNSLALTNDATTNIKVPAVGTSISFTNTGQKVIEVSVVTAFALADGNDDNFEQQSIVSNVAVAVAAADNQPQGAATNGVSFGQSATILFSIRNQAAGNSIGFLDFAKNNIKVLALGTSFTLTDSLARQMVYNQAVTTRALFETAARKVVIGIAGSSVAFASIPVRAATPSSSLAFSIAVSGTTSKLAGNSLLLGQTLVRNLVANRSLGGSVAFGQIVDRKLVGFCNASGLADPGGISLSSSSGGTLLLKNPEFSNTEDLNVTRIVNRSRGGSLHSFKADIWPEETQLSFSVKTIKNAKRLEILAFILASLGELVTLVDQDGRTWSGVIESPESVTITQQADADNYSAQFNLAATLV